MSPFAVSPWPMARAFCHEWPHKWQASTMHVRSFPSVPGCMSSRGFSSTVLIWVALKKLEENTKSLDFGQGHHGHGKDIIITYLFDLMITFEHWSSYWGELVDTRWGACFQFHSHNNNFIFDSRRLALDLGSHIIIISLSFWWTGTRAWPASNLTYPLK